MFCFLAHTFLFLLVNSTKSKLNEVTISSKVISKFSLNLSELKIAIVHHFPRKKTFYIFNFHFFINISTQYFDFTYKHLYKKKMDTKINL